MERDWLIRTKNKHIIGPVSKQKIRELFENGSIKGDDEVCQGNGFWFFLREADMVKKYLLGDEKQPFNPVFGEDQDTPLTASGSVQLNQEELEEEIKFPDEQDLDYPDMENTQ